MCESMSVYSMFVGILRAQKGYWILRFGVASDIDSLDKEGTQAQNWSLMEEQQLLLIAEFSIPVKYNILKTIIVSHLTRIGTFFKTWIIYNIHVYTSETYIYIYTIIYIYIYGSTYTLKCWLNY